MALCHAVFAAWRALKERSARVAGFSGRRLYQSKGDTWQLWRQVISQQKETEAAARAFAAANQLWRSMQRWKGFMGLCEERRGALARCWAMLEAGEQRTRAVAAVKGWRDRTVERYECCNSVSSVSMKQVWISLGSFVPKTLIVVKAGRATTGVGQLSG